jgi:hypothetical protein
MDSAGNTFMNAVVGAVITLVLVVVPFAPAVGGASAGYLQHGALRDGAKAGTVTGLLVTLPLFLGVVALAPIALFAPAGVPSIPMNPLAFVVFTLIATVAYAVGVAALGGSVGAYLHAVRHVPETPPNATTSVAADPETRTEHAPAED